MPTVNYQPQSQYLSSVQQLLAWAPGSLPFDPVNISVVPLRLRPALPANTPLLQDCNDFKGGYVPNADLYPQGTTDANTYAFCYWQFVDSFIYFTHHRISIPTTWWTNTCHLNGVPMLGNVIFEPGTPQAELDLLFNADGKGAAALITMAQYYGFDGWFFNMEGGQPSGGAAAVDAVLKTIRSKGLLSEYYTAYVHNVNSGNVNYLVSSNGYFVDYGWSSNDVNTSIQTAQANDCAPNSVYMGDDCWNRSGPQTMAQIPITMGKLQTATTPYNGACASCGLFAPGWTFEGVGDNNFDTYAPIDAQFWTGAGANGQDSISTSITARLQPAALPLGTNFDRGRGTMMAIRGQVIAGIANWSNLALQGQQPVYPFKAVTCSSTKFTAALVQTAAYDGGACLQVTGSGAVAADSVTYELFDFSSPVSGSVTVTVVFQPMAPVYPGVTVTLVATDGTKATTSAPATQSGGWYTVSQSFSQLSGKTLASLQLTVGGATGGTPGNGYGVQIGLLSVVPDGSQAVPGPVSHLRGWVAGSTGGATSQAYLMWNPPAVPARYYDVWQLGGGSPQWLLRVCANAAWLPSIAGGGSATFGVQPVSFGLVPQPAAQMATVSIDFSGRSFDDTGMGIMSGSVVTGFQVWSGDVLNAVQMTNGSWPMPQHGGSSGMQQPLVTLAGGEIITSVAGFTGNWFGRICVLQITLKSSTGRSYGPYGTMANSSGATAFTLAGNGSALRAFSGTLVNVPLAGGGNTDIIDSLNASFG